MKIAVIGDVIVDEYIYGDCERLSPEAPVPVVKFARKQVCPGGAQNVYKNIRSLTDNVVMATSSPNPPTKVRIIANNHYLLRVDYENHDFEWTHSDTVDTADIVVVSDYNKGAIRTFTPTKMTIVDPKKPLSFYRGAWCIKPNAKEFAMYAGPSDNDSVLSQKMKKVRHDLDFVHLIVTLGEQGVAYVGPDEKFVILPSEAREVFDVTGAGDTFTAVLAYALSINLSMIDAIRLANKGAGVAVSHHGTYVITKHDLRLDQPRTVFTNGCFDIIHRGHIDYLKKSRALGSRLIVGLNSDSSVRRLKGPGRPVNTQEDRKEILLEFPFVDDVIIFDQDTPLELIKKIRPDIITKGGDYNREDVVGYGIADVRIIPFVNGYSSSKIIERLSDAVTR